MLTGSSRGPRCAILGGLRIAGLWITPDEAVWASLGRRPVALGASAIFGGAQRLYSLVYPALVGGLPLAYGGLERGYETLKVLQAIVMSLTAVPVFLWARRLATPGWALLAAALTLPCPGSSTPAS